MTLAIDKFPAITASDYYSEIRNNLKDGDVLLCSGTGIFSAMIQQATGSVWSHVGFILRLDSLERVMLLESVEPIGVRTVRLSKYLENYGNNGKAYPGGLVVIRHREFENTVNKNLKKIAQFAVDRFGYPYDKKDIAKIAARIMSSKFTFTKKQMKKISPNEEYICSEYVAQCYEQIGISVQWDKKGFVAPSNFAADPNFDLIAVLKKK